MATAAVSLAEMVDLAIGSPEVGAVNFSILHGLLHAVLHEIGISQVKAEIHPDALTSKPKEGPDDHLPSKRRKKKKKSENGTPDGGESDIQSDSEPDRQSHSRSGSLVRIQDDAEREPIPLTHMSYHKLADKVKQLEKKFEDLEALPSNSELMDRAKGSEKDKSRAMADMWQAMQLSRKVDANTEGVGKLMSLTEDLMNSLQKLKDENEALRNELAKKLNADDLDELKQKLQDLEKFKKDIEDRLGSIEELIPDRDLLDSFVTWSALEDALKGLRQDLENVQTAVGPTEVLPPPQPQHDIVSRENTQSSKLSDALDDNERPQTGGSSKSEEPERGSKVGHRDNSNSQSFPHPVAVQLEPPRDDNNHRPFHSAQISHRVKSAQKSSRASTPGPSPELQDLLEKLGKLTNRHDALEVRVDRIEDELSRKLSKEDFEKLGVSADVLKKLNELTKDIQDLKDNFSRDAETMRKLEDAMQDLRNELAKLTDTTDRLEENVKENETNVQKSLNSCNELWEKKADKEFVKNELEQKADKEELDKKVDRNEFNLTLEEIYRVITELKEKLASSENDWKSAVEQLNNEMESKIDRLELESLRDDLLKQLKALAKRLAALKAASTNEDDAAGIRRPLRFHCISCDKKVDMTPQKPVPSLPGGYALPENRSLRPYLVYELDQIRQYARGGATQPAYNSDGFDPYARNRQCGGSHTVTYPHKRVMKTGPYPPYPPYQAFDEVDYRQAPEHQAKISREDMPENGVNDIPRSRSRSATRLPNVYETSNKTSQRVTPRVASARTPQPIAIVTSRPDSSAPRAPSVNGVTDNVIERSSTRKSLEANESRTSRSKTMSDIEVKSGVAIDDDDVREDSQDKPVPAQEDEEVEEEYGHSADDVLQNGDVPNELEPDASGLSVGSGAGSARSRGSQGSRSRADAGSIRGSVKSSNSNRGIVANDDVTEDKNLPSGEIEVTLQPATPKESASLADDEPQEV